MCCDFEVTVLLFETAKWTYKTNYAYRQPWLKFEILNTVWMRVYCATVISMEVHKLCCEYGLAWVRITKQNTNMYRMVGVCAGDEVNDAFFLSSASQKEIETQFWRNCWCNSIWGWQTPAQPLEGVIPAPPWTNADLLSVLLSLFMKPCCEWHLRCDLG